MAPASTVLVQYVLLEGDPLLSPNLMHLLRSYPGAYTPLPTSTISPPGPEYANYQPIGWSTDLRDSDICVEGGERGCMYNPELGMAKKIIPSVKIMNKL